MIIGVDASTWSNRRGFGRYTRELVSAMAAASRHELALVVDRATAEGWELPARTRRVVVETSEQQSKAASASGSRSPLDMLRMGRAVARLRPDVFFFPAVYSYFPLLAPVPAAITFHDAIAEHHPELIFPGARSRLFWQAKVNLALGAASAIVTVSEDARRQIVRALHVPESAVHVVPEGPGAVFVPAASREAVTATVARRGLPAGVPLVLYVGGISPHKNLDGLVRAMAHLGDRSWHLALVGDTAGDGFHACAPQIEALAKELGLAQRVTFTGYVPDDDLVDLYGAATMLVLPSMSEGFGLPVVEAMACGLPVAASRRGSLPEVVGDAGLLFDPGEPRDVARAVGALLEDAELRGRLRQAGLERARTFSWREAARRMLGILESLTGAC